MSESTYIAVALTIAVAITATLRAAPFLVKNALRDRPFLDDLSRWMPLGAVTILAVYCLSSIEPASTHQTAGKLAGVIVTVTAHRWRHNTVLSIVVGTAACLAVTNWT